MKQSPSNFALACIALYLVAAHMPLPAQTQRSGGGEAQKFMQQYQQVAAEKTALQAQLAQMKKDLDAATAEIASVKKERDAAKAHVGVSPAALTQAKGAQETAERALEKSKKETIEIVGRYRELATNLRDVEAARTQLGRELAERSSAFDRCAQDNVELFQINGEILDRYDHVGLFTRVSSAEPFTQLTRTRIDNLVVEYRERAEQLRVKKTGP